MNVEAITNDGIQKIVLNEGQSNVCIKILNI
jgi:hypothetical protein